MNKVSKIEPVHCGEILNECDLSRKKESWIDRLVKALVSL